MSTSQKKATRRQPINLEKAAQQFSILSGAASILIALLYGAWGVHLAKRQIKLSEDQEKTSVSIDTFKSLLLKTDVLINQQRTELDYYKNELTELKKLVSKTDTVIDVSNRQLSLNEEQQKIANINYKATQIGEMNRLYGKASLINTMYFNRALIEGWHKEPESIPFLDSIRMLMLQEMNNSYLNSHTALHLKWESGYDKVDWLLFVLNQRNVGVPVDEAELRKCKFNAQTTTGGAANAITDFISAERLKNGLDVKFKKGDLARVSHSIDKHPGVIYKVVGPGKEGGYIFARVSKLAIPNMSDTLDSYYPWMEKLKK